MEFTRQQVEIAKLVGWTNVTIRGSGHCGDEVFVTGDITICGMFFENSIVPDYPTDLNAIHKAVMSLRTDNLDYSNYCSELNQIVAIENSRRKTGTRLIQAIDATASQRAKAFLKAHNKWVECK